MSLKTSTLIASALVLALSGAAQAAAPTVSTSDGQTPLGGQTSGTITLSFSSPYALDAGGFSLQWDTAAIELIPAGTSLAGLSLTQLVDWANAADAQLGGSQLVYAKDDHANGWVILSAATLPAPLDLSNQTLPLVLAFKGLQVGTHAVTYHFDAHDVADPGFGDSLDGALHISVTAVPEPATWALWLAGGLMAGALTRRRGAR